MALLKTVALGWNSGRRSPDKRGPRSASSARICTSDWVCSATTSPSSAERAGRERRFIQQGRGLARAASTPAARRFPGLGLRVNRELELIEPVDTLTRVPRVAGPTRRAPMPDHPRRLEESYRGLAVLAGSPRYWSWLFAAAPVRDPLLGIYALLGEWRALLDPAIELAAAHPKLAWWREEIERLGRGAPVHPISRYIASLPRGGEVDFTPLETTSRRPRARSAAHRLRAWRRARSTRDRPVGAAARDGSMPRGRAGAPSPRPSIAPKRRWPPRNISTMRSRAIGGRRASAASPFRSMSCSRPTSRMRI